MIAECGLLAAVEPFFGTAVAEAGLELPATGNIADRLAPVAQLDRVFASEAKGRAFESRRAHHFQRNRPIRSPINICMACS